MKANRKKQCDNDFFVNQKILIVDDNLVDLNIAVELVIDGDYQVITATNGQDAINLFEIERPNLVIMDVLLEGMDGYEISRKITQSAGNNFIPIIFVTSLNTIEAKVKCLQNGGVDLITKPFTKTVLESKIHTFMSLSSLYASNNQQRQELEYHNKQLKQNYEVASNVFDKVMHSEVLNLPAIKYSLSPIAIFNGDILLAAYRPCGQLQVMLGDFTGHGISAAIGAIPVADIFYGMTAKGFGVSEILQEVNNKMLRILPRGLFLAACFIELDIEENKLTLWNAGLPDALIYNKKSNKVTKTFSSRNYPLGVSNEVSITNTIESYCIKNNDRLLLFTDGVIEARNANRELYGSQRVINDIENSDSEWLIDRLLLKLSSFAGEEQQLDDTTIFEVDFKKIDKPIEAKKDNFYPQPLLSSNWKMDYEFGASILKELDPIPNLIQTIMELQKIQKHKQDIFIIIRELFVNALDHGLLELDSALKHGANGFSNYVAARQKRLTKLEQGKIKIKLQHVGDEKGGVLNIVVEDTGNGFDTVTISNNQAANDIQHGRGIFMVDTICESLLFNEAGNRVQASYRWSASK